MRLKEYQIRAELTDQNPGKSIVEEREGKTVPKLEIIPLLGLVGEVGGLLSEYKKMLRDGAGHEEFDELVAEELGDILWYVSTVATKFNLDLEKIATDNLRKTESRWHEPETRGSLCDEIYPEKQRLPRKFTYKFSEVQVDGKPRVAITDLETGKNIGDPITDNAYEDDGYRYHDVLHLAFLAHFGWSPIFRKLIRASYPEKYDKRDPETDEAEDSGRPKVIEEAIIAAAYVYADQHSFLEGLKVVDWQLLRHIQQMTQKLEVKSRTTWEWNKALINGFSVWRKLIASKGGIVTGDLEKGLLTFSVS